MPVASSSSAVASSSATARCRMRPWSKPCAASSGVATSTTWTRSSGPARPELARLDPRPWPGCRWPGDRPRDRVCPGSAFRAPARRPRTPGPACTGRARRRGPALVRPVHARLARVPRPQPAGHPGRAGHDLSIRRAPSTPSAPAVPRRARPDRPRRADRAPTVRAVAMRPRSCGRSPGHDLDGALIDRSTRRSGGNAFFAEELLVAPGDDDRRRAAADPA